MGKPKLKSKEPAPLKLIKGNEFWLIEKTGKQVTTNLGQIHSVAKQKTLTLGTPEKAKAKYDELLEKQRAAGWRMLGEVDAPKVVIARDEDLEAACREDRDDPAPYLVYADWLQGNGSPLGELIVLAHRKKQKQADAIAKQIGQPHHIYEIESKLGFWRSIHINNSVDWSDASWEPTKIFGGLFASPLCAMLEELRIGMVRWDWNDQPEVVAEAGKYGWAKDLARLTVGDIDDDIDMDHHTIGDIAKVISKSFPNLQYLKLHSGSQTWRGGKETFGVAGFDLPKLKELVIETCAMTTKRMKALTAAKWPALERLELWFGARDRGANAKVGEVAPVWDGKTFPKLRHLALRNNELVTDIVRVLPSSKLAPQLETIDLSMSTMDDSDADELAAEAKKFPKLKRLILDDNFVTAAALKRVKAAFKGVDVSAKDEKERYDWDPNHRYVTVHE